MPRLVKQRSIKTGAPPGTLIHIGRRKAGEVKIRIMSYDENDFEETQVRTIDECVRFKDAPHVTWIDVEGIHQIEIFEKIGSCYGVHPLVLEDILNTDQRPKMDEYEDYAYVVVKMLSLDQKSGAVNVEQVSLILGRSFVISFQEAEGGDVFDPVRERIRKQKGRIRSLGADYLVYSLLDVIVDNYFVILEKLGEQIESLEDDLIANPTTKALTTVHNLKREMIFLRRSVWPLREVIDRLESLESSLINEPTRIFLRDVYDHTIHIIDTIETFREMLSGMLDIYLSSMSNKMNEIMKVLTIIATIFMPLSFIAGVYGMNFKHMPELEWRWGYFGALLIMLLTCLAMLMYFKRKKWL
ncbi:magnesium/cobalt transporter CorA [Candidatus Poribacteria bacterium]|nr:magnesium/cobalt transporter CorA [Candidatus Poribacteria bacterium]